MRSRAQRLRERLCPLSINNVPVTTKRKPGEGMPYRGKVVLDLGSEQHINCCGSDRWEFFFWFSVGCL